MRFERALAMMREGHVVRQVVDGRPRMYRMSAWPSGQQKLEQVDQDTSPTWWYGATIGTDLILREDWQLVCPNCGEERTLARGCEGLPNPTCAPAREVLP